MHSSYIAVSRSSNTSNPRLSIKLNKWVWSKKVWRHIPAFPQSPPTWPSYVVCDSLREKQDVYTLIYVLHIIWLKIRVFLWIWIFQVCVWVCANPGVLLAHFNPQGLIHVSIFQVVVTIYLMCTLTRWQNKHPIHNGRSKLNTLICNIKLATGVSLPRALLAFMVASQDMSVSRNHQVQHADLLTWLSRHILASQTKTKRKLQFVGWEEKILLVFHKAASNTEVTFQWILGVMRDAITQHADTASQSSSQAHVTNLWPWLLKHFLDSPAWCISPVCGTREQQAANANFSKSSKHVTFLQRPCEV